VGLEPVVDLTERYRGPDLRKDLDQKANEIEAELSVINITEEALAIRNEAVQRYLTELRSDMISLNDNELEHKYWADFWKAIYRIRPEAVLPENR
jgi:hypothetical protein